MRVFFKNEKLEILKTAFDDVMIARGPQYAKQLLHSLMTPRVSTNEIWSG